MRKKKKYNKPNMAIVNVESLSMIALSGTAPDTGREHEFEARQHRGVWGDLWSDKEISNK